MSAQVKNISFLFFLFFQLIANTQERNYIQLAEDFVSLHYDLISDKKLVFNKDDLIGQIITAQEDSDEKIYFINEKYYLKIEDNEKILRDFEFITIKGISLMVLFNDKEDKVEGFVVMKNNQEYWINWLYYDDLETYGSLEQADENEVILVDDVEIEDISYYNDPDIIFYVKNGKIGIQSKGKKIIENECDSLDIYIKTAIVYHSGKTSLFHLNGKLLIDNLKSVYQYSTEYNQVIDSLNNMYFIDTLGVKYIEPVNKRWLWGNDTDPNRIVTYYLFENEILKATAHSYKKLDQYNFEDDTLDFHILMYKYSLHSVIYDYDQHINKDDLEFVLEIKDLEELLFLKKVFKGNNKEYLDKIRYYLQTEATSELIELPKKYKNIKFINDSTISMSAEDYWYYVSFYERLKPSYIIAKKSKKYGVWDIEERETVIRFEYEKILSKGTYFLLEKKGLLTYYPNIGSIPKYKYLDDYVQHYARFEYPDGRKGWVDRIGIEYFDEIKK